MDIILTQEEAVSVRDALAQADFELTTLIPRLTPQFRANAEQVRRNVRGAKEILESKR